MDNKNQLSLPLPPSPIRDDTPLVPARMVNEWVYCPRLAYLEWVEGEWADSGDTAQGKRVHARVDKDGKQLPSPEDLGDEVLKTRS
ncbi:MAG: CRISPR-associated endonuclease Cas4/Cas1, partial [Candidatus Dadabacteria bacterium]|nr:CRISPR-associated endonuclease Cas4/Cas1 [Candidatus Dadabacteria bacterium]